METKRVNVDFSVDTIRVIAIFCIILVHTSGYPYVFSNPTITALDAANWFSTNVYNALGSLGVPLFVMLTGALLLNSNKADEPLRVFYKKRWDRLGVPFIFWMIFYYVWSFTVKGEPVTLFNIAQGLVSGSYSHLWYLYLLIGLYSVTPILRVLVKHLNRRLFGYLLILWFAGTTITPFIHTFTALTFDPVMFVFFDWVGYYLLGIYLLDAKFRRSRVRLVAVLGLLGAILGDWALTATMGENYTGYFHGYMSCSIIFASAAVFFLLLAVPANRYAAHRKLNRVIGWISENTLPIYLIHIVFLEIFSLGLIGGIYLNRLTWNLAVDVPIFTFIVFGLSAGSVWLLKKIPHIEKLIG